MNSVFFHTVSSIFPLFFYFSWICKFVVESSAHAVVSNNAVSNIESQFREEIQNGMLNKNDLFTFRISDDRVYL